ncbi:unnamed protein product [Phytophthora fragariaefolia]|uniref:Unnamed protein product n=1 Tax=Phytophthora fragariaefolia TaxID=1490495 RepID=A0A9W6XCU5_9STRA|nr:unnamed protein product [Phytophthora fragariaefolia]
MAADFRRGRPEGETITESETGTVGRVNVDETSGAAVTTVDAAPLVDTEIEPTGPGAEVETPTDPAAGKATAAELVIAAVMTAELDAGMDITVELAVDEATKDVLDNGVGVMMELRTGAEATTGPADEGALVTTPDVGNGARSKIDVDTSSPAELANPMVEAVEHDADNPVAEDAIGRYVGTLESAEADSVEQELVLTSTAELDAVAAELDVAVLIDESWGAEQDTTAESTVGAGETTVVNVMFEVAVAGLKAVATTVDVPAVDTAPVEEVADTPTSTEASSSTSSIGSPRSTSIEPSSPAALAGRATLAAEVGVTELEARRRCRRRRDESAESHNNSPSDTAPKSSPASNSITSSCPYSPGRGIEYSWSGGW